MNPDPRSDESSSNLNAESDDGVERHKNRESVPEESTERATVRKRKRRATSEGRFDNERNGNRETFQRELFARRNQLSEESN